jgi:predicted HicB family RNase H-like nuclease
MRRIHFVLRVPPTLLSEARKAAESEGVALNQLITVGLPEKVSVNAHGRIL